jgi:hypothetical protein
MNPEKLNDALVVMAYLDGEATAQESVHAERLLAEDPEVRDLVEELRATSAPLRDVPSLSLGPGFAAQVLSGLPETPAREAPRSTATTITLRSASSHGNVRRWMVLVASLAAVCLVMALVFPTSNDPNVAHFDTAGPAASQPAPMSDSAEVLPETAEMAAEPGNELAPAVTAEPLAGVAAPAEPVPPAVSRFNGIEAEMAEPLSRPGPAPLRDRMSNGGSRMMVAPEATPAMEAPSPVAVPRAPAPRNMPEVELAPARGMLADSVREEARIEAASGLAADALMMDGTQVADRPLVVYLDVAANGQAEKHFQGLLVQNSITLQVSHTKKQQVAEVYYGSAPDDGEPSDPQSDADGRNRFYLTENVQQVLPSEPLGRVAAETKEAANNRADLRRAIRSAIPAESDVASYAMAKEELAEAVVPSEGVLIEASAEQIEQLLVDLADQPNLYLACSLVQADGVLLKDSDRGRVLQQYGAVPNLSRGAVGGADPTSPPLGLQDNRGIGSPQPSAAEEQSAGGRPESTNGPATTDGAAIEDREAADRAARDKREEKTKVDDQLELLANPAQGRGESGGYAQRVTVEAEEPARQLMQQQALFNDYNRAQYRKSLVAGQSQRQSKAFGGEQATNPNEPTLPPADVPVAESAKPGEAKPGLMSTTDEVAGDRRQAMELKRGSQGYGESLPPGRRVQVLFLLRSVAEDPLLTSDAPMSTEPPVAAEVQPTVEAPQAIEAGPADGR